MAVDPTIALNANRPVAPVYDPQAMLLKNLQTAGAFAQQQRLSMDLQGRRALAQAYQGVTIDPKTGIPDSNQLLSNLQNTPGGSLVLPQVIQGLQEQQKRVYDLNKQGFEQTQARTNAVNSAFAPLMRMGASVRDGDIFQTIAGLHASGYPTDELVSDAAVTMPTRQPGMSDQQYGQQLQSWVVNHAARSWPAGTQAEMFTPKVGTVDTGGQIITRDTNPMTNPGIANAAPIGRTLSPSDQAAQVKGPLGPNGQPTVIPQRQYVQGSGLGDLLPGGGAPQPGQPGQSSPFPNGGRLPPALLNQNRLGAAPAAPPAYVPAPSSAPGLPAAPQLPPPGQPMATGLGPAQQAGVTAAGDASAKQWAGLQSSVGGSAGRLYQLRTALGELQALGPTGTGPSAGMVNSAKSFLSSIPGIGQSLGFDPNQIASYDEANKYLTAYASARAGAHGGTTDNQLATTLSSNASTHISNLAAQNVVKANIGLERMDQAQIGAFQKGLDPVTGQPTGQQMTPDQFSDYSAKFNTAMDPRAFIADQITPQQFASTVNGMQPAERQRFQTTFNTALAHGWIDPPSWMGGQGAPSGASPAMPPASAPPAPTQQASNSPMTLDGNGRPAARGY